MDYDDMLEEGRENLPEDLSEGKRFEIPEAETQKEGNKTIIRNFASIAGKFNRDEKHFSKYLLGELGTAGHVDDGELILNGKFRRGLINTKIEEYTEQYVMCGECGAPDTQMVKEKGVDMLKCEACGARSAIED